MGLNRNDSVSKYTRLVVDQRLWYQWDDKERKDPLQPPFHVFSNTNFDDKGRLVSIVEQMSLPKNTVLKSYDFLRPEKIKNETAYTVTINSLGFRDPPRTQEKPKNVYRIIALGTYQTFGHGLNDGETYPWILENILISQKPKNKVFEVWNGGRQAATAIVGLARLETEILDYNPDLLIWDYGFVDPYVVDDNNFPLIYLFSYQGKNPIISWLQKQVKSLLVGKSALYSKVIQYLSHRSVPKNMEDYVNVNRRMLEFTKENNIPVIFLKQTIAAGLNSDKQKQLFRDFDHATFIAGEDIFKKYPLSLEIKQEFNEKPNWTNEFGTEIRKLRHWRYAEYMTDIFHYNERGYEAIAKYLEEEIAKILNKD